MKIRLFEADYKKLKRKVIQDSILLFVWNLNQLLDKIGVFTKK